MYTFIFIIENDVLDYHSLIKNDVLITENDIPIHNVKDNMVSSITTNTNKHKYMSLHT